ncbi:hypothetical protein GGR50DRAFT_40400 [Xylaria sp. CBS 124048]|nr:hypothetical protein GGR50DRAFT_40400 [Xylaria sp. CBS 124048]
MPLLLFYSSTHLLFYCSTRPHAHTPTRLLAYCSTYLPHSTLYTLHYHYHYRYHLLDCHHLYQNLIRPALLYPFDLTIPTADHSLNNLARCHSPMLELFLSPTLPRHPVGS